MRATRRWFLLLAAAGLLQAGMMLAGSRQNCVPVEPAGPVCPGENPQGCVSTGCAAGQRCVQDPSVCVPSHCECDAVTGAWGCTRDCGGGVCVPEPAGCPGENPQGCVSTGCPAGEVCEQLAGVCVPSGCGCDETIGAWVCTADCSGGVCVPAAHGCDTPNPQGCRHSGCPGGQQCVFDTGHCVPSSCACDPATGSWGCTRDCGGGVCLPGA